MDTASQSAVTLSGEDLSILSELLASERARLLVEIRHTDHRSFRDELRQRLDLVERLLAHLESA